MKIIQEGKFHYKTYVFSCTKCGCIYEVNEDEVRTTFTPKNETYYECSCPWCGSKVYKSDGIENPAQYVQTSKIRGGTK